MRWIWFLAALICLALVFVIDSPGWLALDILGLMLFGTAAVFTFAGARIEANAAPGGIMLSASDLAEIRARGAAKTARDAASAAGPDAVAGTIAALRARAEARRSGKV